MVHEAHEGHKWVSGHDTAKDHVDVLSLYYHQHPYRCPWMGLWPEAILMSAGAEELAPPLGGSYKVALTVYGRAGAVHHRPMKGEHQ